MPATCDLVNQLVYFWIFIAQFYNFTEFAMEKVEDF